MKKVNYLPMTLSSIIKSNYYKISITIFCIKHKFLKIKKKYMELMVTHKWKIESYHHNWKIEQLSSINYFP